MSRKNHGSMPSEDGNRKSGQHGDDKSGKAGQDRSHVDGENKSHHAKRIPGSRRVRTAVEQHKADMAVTVDLYLAIMDLIKATEVKVPVALAAVEMAEAELLDIKAGRSLTWSPDYADLFGRENRDN